MIDQPEPLKIDAFGEQRVRADGQRRLAAGELLDRAAARARALAAEDRLNAKAERLQQRCQLARVLPGQQFGRCHQSRLHAVCGRQQHRRRRNQRLAAADVALQEPVHRNVAPQIVPDLADHPALRAGQRKRQGRFKPFEQVRQGRRSAAHRDRVSRSARRSCAPVANAEKLCEDKSLARALRFLRRLAARESRGRRPRTERSAALRCQAPVATGRAERARASAQGSSSRPSRSCAWQDPCSRDKPERVRRDSSWSSPSTACCVTLTTGPEKIRSTRPRTKRRIPSRKRPYDITIAADPFCGERDRRHRRATAAPRSPARARGVL